MKRNATCLFVLKPLALSELAHSISLQVNLRENALESRQWARYIVRGHTGNFARDAAKITTYFFFFGQLQNFVLSLLISRFNMGTAGGR